MQECYYEIFTRKNKSKIMEVVSDRTTGGQIIPGTFKKIFDHLGERNEFEFVAQEYLNQVGTKISNSDVYDEFMSNCTATPDIFGLKKL